MPVQGFRVIVDGGHDAQDGPDGRVFFGEHFVIGLGEFGRVVVDVDHVDIHRRRRCKLKPINQLFNQKRFRSVGASKKMVRASESMTYAAFTALFLAIFFTFRGISKRVRLLLILEEGANGMRIS